MSLRPEHESGSRLSRFLKRYHQTDSTVGRRFGITATLRSRAILEHKGYLASVECDDSVNVFHGRVETGGPYPIATFEATDPRQLRREFERSVDEYLRWCEEDGVEPRMPFSE